MPKLNKIISVLVAIVVALSANVLAFAVAADTPIDMSRRGSISITLIDANTGNTVTGGSLTAYQIAYPVENNGIYSFEFTDEMKNCGLDLSDLESSSLAISLAYYVKSHDIEGKTINVNNEGKVKFDNLDLGIYLVVQSTVSDNYVTIKSFLVSIPMDVDGELVYDVDATPKASTDVESDHIDNPPDKTTSPNNPSKPDKPENPTVKPTTPNEQTKPNKPDIPSDKTTTSNDSTKPDKPDKPNIPKTGQLWWPVPILSSLGVIAFVNGYARKKKEDE